MSFNGILGFCFVTFFNVDVLKVYCQLFLYLLKAFDFTVIADADAVIDSGVVNLSILSGG